MKTTNPSLKFFSAPVFGEDENKTRLAYYISVVVPASILTLLVVTLTRIRRGEDLFDPSILILLGISGILLIAWVVVKLGSVQLAGYITIGSLCLASSYIALSLNGLRGVGFVSYFVVLLLAGLLLGARAATGVAILSILSAFGLAYAETAGLIEISLDPPFIAAVKLTILFIMCAIIIRSTINSLQHALQAAQENSRKLAISNQELTQLRDDLESRIQERTASLEKRALQLEALSSMARNITSIKDLDALLPNTTRLVSEQFGFYHTGIFLMDAANEFAELKAANSEGGRQMLARGHRLPLDVNSIVGFVALRGDPRIAIDVGADTAFFNNPDLPETRSEMALPLRAGRRVIGVLDVQSREKNAFSQDDIFVLSTLADQIAVAIENVQLFEENQKALSEARTAFENYVRQEWRSFSQKEKHSGFIYDGKQVAPLDKKFYSETPASHRKLDKPSIDDQSSTISLPIKLRGQTIGVLDVRSRGGVREWTRGEISLLEAAADRAALALENARLVESAQQRASRERTIGEISARIGAVSDIDSILQTAVEELGRKLTGATEVVLELDPEQI